MRLPRRLSLPALALLLAAGPHAAWTPGTLQDRNLSEASGLAPASGDGWWAVNDSGNAAFLYRVGPQGEALGRVRVSGASNRDWEALGTGPCPSGVAGQRCLYIADIGDNGRERRQVRVEIVPEPPPEASQARVARTLFITYDGGPRDAESLLIGADGADLFIIEKRPRSESADGARMFRLPIGGGEAPVVARPVGRLLGRTADGQIAGPFTDGAMLPESGGFVVRDYRRVYRARLPDRLDSPLNIILLDAVDDTPLAQAEALAVSEDGGRLALTSEGRGAPLVMRPAP